jgi:glycosyltransferase involved in cell wall biosynthesis
MKILQINKYYYRRRGAETYFLDLIDLLQHHGHEVAVFAMNHPETISNPYQKYFIDDINLESPRHLTIAQQLTAAKQVIWNTQAQKRLEELLQVFKPDIAHIHNIYHQISPSILATLKKHHIPVVQTLHDYKLLCPNYQLFTQGSPCERCQGHNYYNAVKYNCLKNSRSASTLAMVEMYIHKALQIYERSVDCFISPSQFLDKKIDQWGIKVNRKLVLPNFIDTAMIKPVYQHQGYLVYAGGLYPEKGVDLLLDAMHTIEYTTPLHVVGAGPQMKTLKAKANPKYVTFTGQLTKANLAQELQGAKAVIVPSRWYENYPFSVLEAFAYGKPVLAANHGGLPELVRPGVTGWLFEANNPTSLAQALQLLNQTNDETMMKLGQQAQQFVEQQLTPQQHYQALYDLYLHYAQA